MDSINKEVLGLPFNDQTTSTIDIVLDDMSGEKHREKLMKQWDTQICINLLREIFWKCMSKHIFEATTLLL